ncbi:MAG: type II secretion system minor pseudopilin GspK [Pseudomonadales bacterium]|jgi:general secretion pathway protein K|nr:type II secretion system minor pseudopilin GspK [Pseudomonadales bacterium]MDP6473031.1 type II secretion system minor pseudopilin GspK [Pseudomonadales bacterium]MDP6826212.1 type II secretion system minor pseudopilin GspK [Pseudomonadales bacterium]MDP6973329.1 type II secretion system minor pseudopilin GspK [Pseudomonadales bacterium]|tara:strand:+ start:636 stop:1637 length:1002 start_codon:yes stop_codon:yes gene_type:complete
MKARRSRGVVLVSVLLVVALLTAVVYQLVERHSLAIAQSRNGFGYDQALAYALGAETFARQILFEDFSETDPAYDTLMEDWAQPLMPFDLDDGGKLEMSVSELNHCFNMNALGHESNEQVMVQFKRLLRNLSLPEPLADAWRDWVDADEDITGFGAEDGDYLLEEVPYRAANQLAGHVSESTLVKGMDAEVMEVLAPHICVLPDDELWLNVNTASPQVLSALNDNVDEMGLVALAEEPREFEDVGEFTQNFQELVPVAQVLKVTSAYFEVQVRAQIGDSTAVLTSLLHRDPEDGRITLLQRDMGRDFRSALAIDDEATARAGTNASERDDRVL